MQTQTELLNIGYTRSLMVAFFKGRHAGIVDRLICFFTGGRYSHAELVFEDERSWSSSRQDGGVRFKKIGYSSHHKWDFITLVLGIQQYADVLAFCESKNGKEYDWMGALSFLLPVKQDRKRLFCSEAIVKALHHGGILNSVRASCTTPTGLWKDLVLWFKFEAGKTKDDRQKAV